MPPRTIIRIYEEMFNSSDILHSRTLKYNARRVALLLMHEISKHDF
jgi:hypothetical protein